MATLKELLAGLKARSANSLQSVGQGLRGLGGRMQGEAPPVEPTPTPQPEAVKAAPESATSGIRRNPNVQKGVPSAEAKAFQAAGGGRASTLTPGVTSGATPETPKLGKVGKFVRGIGAVQAAKGVYDTATGDYGNAADNITMGAATALNPLIGTAGNILTGLRDSAIKYFVDKKYPEYNPNIYTPQLRSMVEAGKMAGTDTSNVQVAQPQPASALAQPTAAPALRGAAPKLTDDLATGEGRFQRTTPGNVGPVRPVGTRTDNLSPASLAVPQGTTLAKHLVNLAALNAKAQAASAREQGAATEAGLGIKAATARTTAADVALKSQKQTGDTFDKQVANYVNRSIDSKLPKEERDAVSNQRVADVKSRIDYTLADTGKSVDSITDAEKQKIFLADKFRTKLMEQRSGALNQLRDYFGASRFDSDNLYSYMPKEVIRTSTGYDIRTQNGNTMSVSDAAGGGFVLSGPNIPVDKDMMQEIIDVAKKQSKGK